MSAREGVSLFGTYKNRLKIGSKQKILKQYSSWLIFTNLNMCMQNLLYFFLSATAVAK